MKEKTKEQLLKKLQGTNEKLRKRNEQLIEERNLKEELAEAITHEIRGLLSIIGMSAQHLQEKLNPEDSRRKLTRVIIENVQRLEKIIRRLIENKESLKEK